MDTAHNGRQCSSFRQRASLSVIRASAVVFLEYNKTAATKESLPEVYISASTRNLGRIIPRKHISRFVHSAVRATPCLLRRTSDCRTCPADKVRPMCGSDKDLPDGVERRGDVILFVVRKYSDEPCVVAYSVQRALLSSTEAKQRTELRPRSVPIVMCHSIYRRWQN